MTTKDVRHDIEALRKDLGNIQQDLRRLATHGGGAAKSATSEALDNVKSAAASAVEEGTGYVRSALHDATEAVRGTGKQVVAGVQHQIGAHPASTVLLTLGLGFALGLYAARRRA